MDDQDDHLVTLSPFHPPSQSSVLRHGVARFPFGAEEAVEVHVETPAVALYEFAIDALALKAQLFVEKGERVTR